MYTPIFYRSYDALKIFLYDKNLHTIYVLDKYDKNIFKVHTVFVLKNISEVNWLTEVAGEGGTNCPPQKFLLSQQFRYLMRCKKYL